VANTRLKELILTILGEMSTTGNIDGYDSKYFIKPEDEDEKEKYDIDYSGEQGTGDDRKDRTKPLSIKEMGPGMRILRDAIRQIIKSELAEDYILSEPDVTDVIRLLRKFPADKKIRFKGANKIANKIKIGLDGDTIILEI